LLRTKACFPCTTRDERVTKKGTKGQRTRCQQVHHYLAKLCTACVASFMGAVGSTLKPSTYYGCRAGHPRLHLRWLYLAFGEKERAVRGLAALLDRFLTLTNLHDVRQSRVSVTISARFNSLELDSPKKTHLEQLLIKAFDLSQRFVDVELCFRLRRSCCQGHMVRGRMAQSVTNEQT